MTESRQALAARGIGCLLAAVVAAPAAAQSERLHRYTVRPDADLRSMQVEACLDATAMPAQLVASATDARRYLRELRVRHDERELAPRPGRRGIALDDVAPGSCIGYRVDLAGAAGSGMREARRVGADLATHPGLWLWRPRSLAPDVDLEIAFELPAGMSVSAPWALVTRSADTAVFRAGHTPHSWPGVVAFGRFEVASVEIPGARLRIAVLDGTPRANVEDMHAWLSEAAGAMATLYGEFPLRSPQILVFPLGRESEAVPWAQVMRGGGAAAHFHIDQLRPLREFRDDWTAAHELSHMLLPYLDRDDAWLSEGFASYYQNVLRARAGMITPAQAWSRLDAGFRRGERGTDGGSLSSTSRNMYRNRAYMRVYWSGAAFALLTDLALRKASAGRQSLDTALLELRRCCLPADRMWSGPEFLERMDAITQTTLFSEPGHAFMASDEFPSVAAAYRELGLRTGGRDIALDDDAIHARLRDAIMAPRPAQP